MLYVITIKQKELRYKWIDVHIFATYIEPILFTWFGHLCFVKAAFLVYSFPHSHLYGLSPVCILRWRASEDDYKLGYILILCVSLKEGYYIHTSPNDLWQFINAHACGFSLVCVRKCTVNADRWINCFPQPIHWQWKGFSPVCMRSCLVRSDFLVNDLPQSLQWHINDGLRLIFKSVWVGLKFNRL
jgi:hypothetical protein